MIVPSRFHQIPSRNNEGDNAKIRVYLVLDSPTQISTSITPPLHMCDIFFRSKNIDIASQQQWAASTLTSLITCSGVDRPTVLSSLQFLFLNAYFDLKGSSNTIPHVSFSIHWELIEFGPPV
jgi:hypothetical protein